MTDLPAGRELDALVAEKVMGWRLVNYETYEPATTPEDYECAAYNDGWEWEGWDEVGEAWKWRPSTDIAAAWQVVEGFDVVTLERTAHGKWWASLWRQNDQNGSEGADTAPLAICRAALAAA